MSKIVPNDRDYCGACRQFVDEELTVIKGRYHHWDGYPSGLGKALWDVYHDHFNRDIDGMLKLLLEDHPAGWSTIVNKDFSLEPGFDGDHTKPSHPECYCHGDRNEGPHELTHEDASGCGVEWAYVFDRQRRQMKVTRPIDDDGEPGYGIAGYGPEGLKFHVVAVVDLDADGSEPDWEKLNGITEPQHSFR